MEKLEKNTLEKIHDCILANNSFILEAGAGSGKTYTLIQTIQFLLEEKSNYFLKSGQKIACITYTNVAKDELKKRLDFNELVEINTIHEFLWSIISNYQVNLKKELLEYNETFDDEKKIENLEEILKNIYISYTGKYGRNFKKGFLHHDDVIYLSIKLLEKYEKLQQILIGKYPYFFIDEYQDTQKDLVTILLSILDKNKENFLLGFFGDFMQKIYQDNRIGKIENPNLEIIQKTENYRSGKKIVNIINKIRNIRENLIQIPQKDFDGEISLYYSNTLGNEEKYNKVKELLGWDFLLTPSENKILVLSNSKIAKNLGFENLLKVFDNRFGGGNGFERLKQKEEAYTDFLLNKIEKIIEYYENKDYSEFFKLFGDDDFKIKTLKDREILKKLIDDLIKIRNERTIGDVFNYIYEKNILTKSDKIISFEEYLLEELEEDRKEKQNLSEKFKEDLMSLSYKEIINYNKFLENNTPYSTQHGTKGAEYNNVLLVIDEEHKWWMYKGFDDLISGKRLNKDEEKHLEKLERLLNLLYVSVSRAKEKLVILYLSKLDDGTLEGWKNIIGEENIKALN